MHVIRLTYFFLPLELHVQSNPGEENVIILRPTIIGTFEFLRIPVPVAHQFADLLEASAENAASTPIISGQVGEINGIAVRALGTIEVRIRLLVKRSNSIRMAIRKTIKGLGKKTQYSTPQISGDEARRFAKVLREANAVTT